MDYCTADARKEFDKWSRRYDWDPLQPLFFRPSHRMLLDSLQLTDCRILDIGCGTGRFAASVFCHIPNAEVWGLDLSAGMLRRAAARNTIEGGQVRLVQADSEHLPFPDDYFNAVTCSHSFHHYPNQHNVLAEMHRVLRPDGRLLLIDGDRDRLWGWFVFNVIVVLIEGGVVHRTGEDFIRMCAEAGFKDLTQSRRKGPLPFLMTVGRALKNASAAAIRRAG